VFAQAAKEISPQGTTHADHFYGSIPITRTMKHKEVIKDYEKNTGKVIVETMNSKHIDYEQVPAILVYKHGPFTWGRTAEDSVMNAIILEEIAKTTYHTLQLNPRSHMMNQYLLDKHFWRKHGEHAYYGQSEQSELV